MSNAHAVLKKQNEPTIQLYFPTFLIIKYGRSADFVAEAVNLCSGSISASWHKINPLCCLVFFDL